jgi:hypothetical protein
MLTGSLYLDLLLVFAALVYLLSEYLPQPTAALIYDHPHIASMLAVLRGDGPLPVQHIDSPELMREASIRFNAQQTRDARTFAICMLEVLLEARSPQSMNSPKLTRPKPIKKRANVVHLPTITEEAETEEKINAAHNYVLHRASRRFSTFLCTGEIRLCAESAASSSCCTMGSNHNCVLQSTRLGTRSSFAV